MSLIRTRAARSLGKAIADSIELAAPPTIVNAPPSRPANYPAVAILIDESQLNITSDEYVEIDPTKKPGDVGYVLDGSFRTDENNVWRDGDLYIDGARGGTLSCIGSIRCKGRIWVAGRTATLREQLENDVWLVFMQDTAAPSRILLDCSGVVLAGVRVPFGTAAADVESSTWSPEMAYGERLWSYITFNLDVPLIVPRFDPIVETLVLAVTSDLATAVDAVQDLAKLGNVVEFEVDREGNVESPYADSDT